MIGLQNHHESEIHWVSLFIFRLYPLWANKNVMTISVMTFYYYMPEHSE